MIKSKNPDTYVLLPTTPKKSKASCSFQYVPARYVLSFLTFWAMCLEFAHRVCLSVTIVAMVNHTAVAQNSNDTTDNGESCPISPMDANDTTTDEMGTYVWSPSIQGVVLGAYFYGYICTQLVGGRLAEVFGGKWLMGLSILLGSLLTLATPAAADLSVIALVVLRILMGMLHGVCLPTAYAMFSQWAPDSERSTLLTLCIIGDHVGTVISMPLAGYLSDQDIAGGWPMVYYVLGSLGCIWFMFWISLAYSLPAEHPRISQDELDYISENKRHRPNDQKVPVPWKDILTSPPVWALVIVGYCCNWGYSTLLTKLPTYLELVLHVPIKKNGLVNSIVYICGCLTLFLSAYLSDYLRTRTVLSATTVRKAFTFTATMGTAICTGLIPYIGCSKSSAIVLLSASMTLLGLTGGGHLSGAVDMAPNHAGSLFGLVNGISCTSGIFSPLVAGLLLEGKHDSIEEWSKVFYVATALYIGGGIVFTFFGSAERQAWSITTTKNAPKLKSQYEIIDKKFESSITYGSTS